MIPPRLCLISFVCFAGSFLSFARAQEADPSQASEPSRITGAVTAKGAKVREVASGYKFTEGPTADENGNVFFTDQPNDQIIFYDFATQKASQWLSPCGRSNGLFFVTPERMIACADHQNELWSIDTRHKKHSVLSLGYQDRKFGGPNDCWVDQDGSIYFSDPLYQRPYWTQQFPEDHPRSVFRLAPDGTLSRVAGDLTQPNGIMGDAENRLLWVADIGKSKIHRYSIAEDGSLMDKKLFCSSGSDGMTIDEERNVYLTGKEGVTVFNALGAKIETIATGKGWTSNVTFAGPENRHLFITASDSVLVVKMRVRGL